LFGIAHKSSIKVLELYGYEICSGTLPLLIKSCKPLNAFALDYSVYERRRGSEHNLDAKRGILYSPRTVVLPGNPTQFEHPGNQHRGPCESMDASRPTQGLHYPRALTCRIRGAIQHAKWQVGGSVGAPASQSQDTGFEIT
jgi:hypothetical protein